MNSTILVTGATGNVGSEVIKILLKKGITVRAAIRKPGEEKVVDLKEQECVLFDFLDTRTYGPAFDGVKSIFLMRPPALANPKKEIAPAIQAAKKAGVRHIVFMSLLGAEKNPLVPHRKIEKLILDSGLPYTFLRPSFFMQNFSTTHAFEIKSQNEILVPAGHGKTGFIDVRDIAAVAAEALTREGFEYTALPLTGSEAITYSEVAAILTRVLGRPIAYHNPSILSFVLALRKRNFDYAFIAVMIAIYTVNKLGLAATVTSDVERVLGRKPIQFEQFAADFRSAWM